MKHRKFIVVAVGVMLAFAAGHLTAQPVVKQPVPVVDAEKEAFLGDLGAAVKANHHSKVISLLNEAAGDSKFTDAVVLRTWDMTFNADPKGDRRDVLAATFAMQQRQRQIELMEAILLELKKSNATKAK